MGLHSAQQTLYTPLSYFGGGINGFSLGSWINGQTAWIAKILGMDEANGRLFFMDGSNGNFGQSDDFGVTLANGMGIPANTTYSNMIRVVAFDGYIYLLSKDNTSGQWGIYRAPVVAAGTPLTWSGQIFTLSAAITTVSVATMFYAGQTAIVIGEYGDPVGGPSLYRLSLADARAGGTNWVSVYGPITGTRHCHSVAEDPYNPGTWYACFGDSGAISVAKSRDDALTWTPIIATTAEYQAVQIGFTRKWIYFANDRVGISLWVMDRATNTPRVVTRNWHGNIPVPGGLPGRTVTDMTMTPGSKNIGSATAAFVSTDVNRMASSSSTGAVGLGNFIASVTSGTAAVLNSAAASFAPASGNTLTIEGERFRRQCYWGAPDPLTDIFYFVSNDASAGGNRIALFYVDINDGIVQLLDNTDYSARGGSAQPIFIGGGYVWMGAAKHKLLTRAAA